MPGVTSETCHHISLCLFQANTTARQLLQTSKSHWSPQFKCASLRTASPKAKGADSPAFPKVPDSRRKSLRQFSITTALNTLNRMVHAPAERQALEISSPVLISSSNPTVATQSSEKAEFPYGTPLQVRKRRRGCCRSGTSPKCKSWVETPDAQAAIRKAEVQTCKDKAPALTASVRYCIHIRLPGIFSAPFELERSVFRVQGPKGIHKKRN